MHALVERLNKSSVTKRFDAYRDVEWELPEHHVRIDDPRWELDESDSLGATSWYRSLPQAARARLGLHIVVHHMKVGIFFESILSRGLLEFAATLPVGSSLLRYVHHEVIEEGQHSLMFRELVARSGLDAPGLSGLNAFTARFVPGKGRTFPELFFVFVLGGELPIDGLQRRLLRRSREIHPLLRRIMQIHVTEEARHVAFAENYLRENIPRLSRWRQATLALRMPFILAAMAQEMLEPHEQIIREHTIPRRVLIEAYRTNAEHRRSVVEHFGPLRELAVETGVAYPWLWKLVGLWG